MLRIRSNPVRKYSTFYTCSPTGVDSPSHCQEISAARCTPHANEDHHRFNATAAITINFYLFDTTSIHQSPVFIRSTFPSRSSESFPPSFIDQQRASAQPSRCRTTPGNNSRSYNVLFNREAVLVSAVVCQVEVEQQDEELSHL